MVEPPGPPPMTSTSHRYSGEGVGAVDGAVGIGSDPREVREPAFYRAGVLVQVLHNAQGASRYCFLASRRSGAATPMEMTYLSASSTLMSSSITSALRIIRKKPEVGFGVVGTYTLT